jgi:capsid protein
MEAQLKLIGMAVNIPYEVLIKSFNASYSASQASIQDAARGWKIAGNEWAYRYCQPVYDQFVEMLVRLKVIDAPGFFDNPIIRNAWCRAKWRGPAMLHVDPRKSVESYINAINNNLITRESASQALYGEDWDMVNDRNAQELQKMRDRGVGVNDKGYIKLINEAEDDDGNPIGGNQ